MPPLGVASKPLSGAMRPWAVFSPVDRREISILCPQHPMMRASCRKNHTVRARELVLDSELRSSGCQRDIQIHYGLLLDQGHCSKQRILTALAQHPLEHLQDADRRHNESAGGASMAGAQRSAFTASAK